MLCRVFRLVVQWTQMPDWTFPVLAEIASKSSVTRKDHNHSLLSNLFDRNSHSCLCSSLFGVVVGLDFQASRHFY